MRETRSSGSVEGVMGNHDSNSDSSGRAATRAAGRCRHAAAGVGQKRYCPASNRFSVSWPPALREFSSSDLR